MNPDLLIITDNDTLYGINKGYYPDLSKSVNSGNLLVLSEGNWRDQGLRLKTNPLCSGEDVYIRNPYTNCYILASDNELLDDFIESKSIAIKEAFVWLGAKKIVLDEKIQDKDTLKIDADGEASKIAKGSLHTSINRISTVEISTLIESEDPNRQPKAPSEIEKWIQMHGLANDPKITTLLDRLKIDGRLNGSERYTVKYLNEIEFALKILASIDYKVFSSNLDFSFEHNHIHSITKKISLDF